MSDFSRDIGSLEARADATDARLARIESKIDKLAEYIAENKGGIRTLLVLGSLAASAGAAIAELIHWLHAR